MFSVSVAECPPPVWEGNICLFRSCFWLCVCVSFPFGFEGGIWDLIVLIPDYYLSSYFSYTSVAKHLSVSLSLNANLLCILNH